MKLSEINYAEGNIDLIINNIFFKQKNNGIFIDVGAGRPDYLSISALYRKIGWKIIAIEPNPIFAKLYRKLKYPIIECACGSKNQKNIDFYLVNSHNARYENGFVTYESYSSLGIRKDYEQMWTEKYNKKLDIKKIKVEVRTLNSILNSISVGDKIDILSIDVEGWELDVLEGFDIDKYKPKIIVLENIHNDKNYHKYMQRNKYIKWLRIQPNEIYIQNNILNQIRRICYKLKIKIT